MYIWQELSQGADIASASTITLLQDGNYHHVTGTTGITAIAASSRGIGAIEVLEFTGAALLTNSANLILAGGVNYTTAAGDAIGFVYEGSSVWREIHRSGSSVVGTAATQTLTNKRITKRAVATTQSATPAINTDVTDVSHITGLAQAITSMTSSLTGTPVEGDTLRIDITDNGTPRAITWGASFEASTVALPTTTVISARLDVGFVWNTATSKWRCVAAC